MRAAVWLLTVGIMWGADARMASLKTAAIPRPANLARYVRDDGALVALGKAFFWDVQASSDGRVACATCHFHAGADHRVQNQLGSPPGMSAVIAPNQVLTPEMFPFRKLADARDNRSPVVSEMRVTAGSAGQFHRRFLGLAPGSATENGSEITGEANLILDGLSTRQVTGRNSPSVINAVFDVRNFWDGRASPIFTGATPFGDSDTRANLLVAAQGTVPVERVRLENASLASQALGPALSPAEMSYEGRTWPIVGRKLLALPPLARQRVAPDDSVLGGMANRSGPGLLPQFTYTSLIQAAFRPEYWRATDTVDVNGNAASGDGSLSQMEFNFSFYWGLAVMAYEATLVSDDTRVDRFAEGHIDALTAQEQQGLTRFLNSTCVGCHAGAELTMESYAAQTSNPGTHPMNLGFMRTGVSPVAEDIGFGFTDSFGVPLFQPQSEANGTFKTTGFRNIELTGPYFHNGSQATLEQVMDFYNRHGDIPEGGLGPGMTTASFTDDDKAAMVAFMKALTDDRVRYERSPFDHPELCVPMGHVAASSSPQFPKSAQDRFVLVPMVGAKGNAAPLQTFEELLRGIGNDGSRAHTMTVGCVP